MVEKNYNFNAYIPSDYLLIQNKYRWLEKIGILKPNSTQTLLNLKLFVNE